MKTRGTELKLLLRERRYFDPHVHVAGSSLGKSDFIFLRKKFKSDFMTRHWVSESPYYYT